MYDAVLIVLRKSFDESQMSRFPLDRTKMLRNIRTGETSITGNLKNLRVRATDTSLLIAGSLPKFHLGSNLQTLTRQETQKAIQNLSDRFGLHLHKARIYKVEIGTNFEVQQPVQCYFAALGHCRYYEKSTYSGGVLYKNTQRAMEFYDKLLELRKHKESIPPGYQGKNILRYELKFNTRLRKQTGLIKASDLFNEKVYQGMLRRWEHEYFTIQRQQIIACSIDNIANKLREIHTVKQLEQTLSFIGFSKLGETTLHQIIKQNTNISNLQRCRINAKIKKLVESNLFTVSNDILADLDNKIKEITSLGY